MHVGIIPFIFGLINKSEWYKTQPLNAFVGL